MNKKDWLKNSIGYQIYIRSFFDADNDGLGDIKGIEKKLDYLKDLGIDFIWICPFFDSVMDDNGYDTKNYYKVNSLYGTNASLKKLVKEIHKRDMKIILDLVLNHTSDENEWFVKSENKVKPYKDFYIWKDGKIKNGKLIEPNNWKTFFGDSAWKYSEKRKQYYLRIFSKKMPDINYECEQAFIEMENVIKYYGEMGIDGFRVDAVSHLGKDLSFKDTKDENKSYMSYSNLKNCHKYLKRLNKTFNEYNLVTMGELGGNPTKKDLKIYTTEKELDAVFSFEQMKAFNSDNTVNTLGLIDSIKYKSNLCDKNGWSMLFLLNHDYVRLISKIRNEKDSKNICICMAGLMYMGKGTPIIYNGEEIGMENYPFKKLSDFKDINTLERIKNTKDRKELLKELKENSRNHTRTVMQWNDSENAGFSKSENVIPYVNPNYKKCNVEESLNDEKSILNNYKKLFKIRKEYGNDLINAKYKFFNKNNMIGYNIKTKDYILKVIANFGINSEKLNLKNGKVIYSNLKFNEDLKPNQLLIIKY